MNYKIHELLILTFARVNPVFFKSVLERIGKVDQANRDDLAQRVRGFTYPNSFLGYSRVVGSSPAASALQDIYQESLVRELADTYHVFPTWCNALGVGLMVPLAIQQAEDWHVSDAFGRFGFSEGERGNPLMSLLKAIEKQWDAIHSGQILPLRWRQPLSLKIHCQIHLEAIDGGSLQVPLILSVLRSLAEGYDSIDGVATLPFGNRPVFTTGKLGTDRNLFWKVGHVQQKLEGFVREYGEGLPALLQTRQIQELPKELLDKIDVYEVNSIAQLLVLPQLSKPLEALSGAVHSTEIDTLLSIMSRNSRALRFDDVADMASWLLPSLDSPVYLFQFHRQAGLVYAHKGNFVDSYKEFQKCYRIYKDQGQLLGLTDRCNLATLAGIMAEDTLDVNLAMPLFDDLAPFFDMLPVRNRVAYWGARCQLLRLERRYDEAVQAGKEAVRLADLGRACDSGRDRNYLIHALLGRAKEGSDTKERQNDLRLAGQLINESKGKWAPRDHTGTRRSHLTFCLHYEAELARLEKRQYSLPDSPPWSGHWSHAWYFALLCCARNEAYELDVRKQNAIKLVAALQQNKATTILNSLFFMLLQVYRIYANCLSGLDYSEPLVELRNWCDRIEAAGFPNWKSHFGPCLTDLENVRGDIDKAEYLCDLVPFH